MTNSNLKFLLIARMLKDKGVREYIEAASIVRKKYSNTRFQLLGEIGSDNPSSISKATITQWTEAGIAEYLGRTEDVRRFLEVADCIVLPSYREGTPRSLLEAAATGKPIITTNVPGCRTTVDDEVTGYLCKVKDSTDLANKMIKIIELSDKNRQQLGDAGRKKMEAQFDEKLVIGAYIKALKNVPKGRYRIRKKLIESFTTSRRIARD